MIDWKRVKHFVPSEFSGDTELAEPELIYSLDALRALTGERTYPSPVPGTLARVGGSKSSQHYVGEDYRHISRKATAVDVFMEGIPIENYQTILTSGLFKGVGIYPDATGPDGKPWVMFHLDIRDNQAPNGDPLTWFGVKEIKDGEFVTKYRYPQYDARYWELFRHLMMYKEIQRKG